MCFTHSCMCVYMSLCLYKLVAGCILLMNVVWVMWVFLVVDVKDDHSYSSGLT